MTKLEQIARAIEIAAGPFEAYDDIISRPGTSLALAHAAVEELREPTERMICAGEDAVNDGETYCCRIKAEEAYRTMIQVILNEKP